MNEVEYLKLKLQELNDFKMENQSYTHIIEDLQSKNIFNKSYEEKILFYSKEQMKIKYKLLLKECNCASNYF